MEYNEIDSTQKMSSSEIIYSEIRKNSKMI